MLKIRLRRMGSRHRAFYRVVVSDSRRTPGATALEEVGYYNPRTQPVTLKLDIDRVEHWMTHGAQPSSTVRKLVSKAMSAPAEVEAVVAEPVVAKPVVAKPVVAEAPAVTESTAPAVVAEDVVAEDVVAEDVVAEDVVAEAVVAEDVPETAAQATASDAVASEPTADEAVASDDETADGETEAKKVAETAADA